MSDSVATDIISNRFMEKAIAQARQGMARGQTPFGACLVRRGRVVAVAHNGVWLGKDITAHAEVVAIRRACRALKTIDLSGCVLYSTCEPCPMCFGASHWARIPVIVYGADIRDAQQGGFQELAVSNAALKRLGKSPVRLVRGFMQEECRALFREWCAKEKRRVY